VEHGYLAGKFRAIETRHRLAVALEAGKGRQIGAWGSMADQGGGDARRIAAAQPQYEQCSESEECDERDEHEHPPSPGGLLHHALFHQFTTSPHLRVPSAG